MGIKGGLDLGRMQWLEMSLRLFSPATPGANCSADWD